MRSGCLRAFWRTEIREEVRVEVQSSRSRGGTGYASYERADWESIGLVGKLKIKDLDWCMALESAVEIIELNSELDFVVGDAGENVSDTCEVRLRGWMLYRSEILR